MSNQPQKLTPSQQQALDDARDERIRKEEERRGGAPTPQRPVNTPKPDRGANYRKGGYVSSADGCAVKGKTKGRMV